MSNKKYTKRQRKTIMKHYRSNQGRSPKKEEQIFKVLKVVAIATLVIFLLYLVFH